MYITVPYNTTWYKKKQQKKRNHDTRKTTAIKRTTLSRDTSNTLYIHIQSMLILFAKARTSRRYKRSASKKKTAEFTIKKKHIQRFSYLETRGGGVDKILRGLKSYRHALSYRIVNTCTHSITAYTLLRYCINTCTYLITAYTRIYPNRIQHFTSIFFPGHLVPMVPFVSPACL